MTFLLMLCGGCGEIGAPVWGNQIGQASDRGYCDEGAVVGLDEAVPAGFTTRGFFDASGSVDATLFWLGGAWKHPASPTPLTVTFQPAGEPEFRDVGFDGCLAHVRIEVDTHLASDDGALDDDFRSDLWLVALDDASFYAELDPATLSLDTSDAYDPNPTSIVFQHRSYLGVFGGVLTSETDNGQGGSGNSDLAAW